MIVRRGFTGSPRLLLLPILTVLMLLSGCPSIPDSYAPPIQRRPVTGPEPPAFGHFVDMNDPNADAYILRDISDTTEGGGFRWVHERPELRFALSRIHHLKFVMDFAIPSVTLKQTGPVTISFYINEKLLDKLRCETPGEKHFEKPVPAEWLRTDTPTLVAAEIDKVYIAPQDGAKLGFVLTRAGFVE
jgi:hypothetical protein